MQDGFDTKDNEILLVVDENDEFSGEYITRGVAHAGSGKRHRAFVCLIVNGQGRTLLQKRRHWLWDNLWDFAAVSHVLKIAGRDEDYQEAATRALLNEMGIKGVEVRQRGGFAYFEPHAVGDACEHEYCAILLGNYRGPLTPDPGAIYETRWVPVDELLREIQAGGENFTPWARLAVQTMLDAGQWPPR